jgi:hypothetical protein
MQRNGLYALIAVTILVLIGAVAVSLSGPSSQPQAGAGEAVLAGFADKLGSIATVKITGEGGVTLERKGEGDKASWVVAEKGGYPAEKTKVAQALLGFAELKRVEPKTSRPDLYERLDLDDPGKKGGHARLVEFDDAAGKKLGELVVGKRRPDRLGGGNDGLYVRIPGQAQTWLAQGSVDLPTEAGDWLDPKIVSIEPARIRQVTLTHADGSRLVLKRDKPEDKFAVEGAPADAKIKGDSLLAEPAEVLNALSLSDVKPAAELKLPEKGVDKAEWQTFDGLTVTGQTFDQDGKNWLVLEASGTDKASQEAADLNAKTANWVFAVYSYKTTAMKTKLADLIEPAKGS